MRNPRSETEARARLTDPMVRAALLRRAEARGLVLAGGILVVFSFVCTLVAGFWLGPDLARAPGALTGHFSPSVVPGACCHPAPAGSVVLRDDRVIARIEQVGVVAVRPEAPDSLVMYLARLTRTGRHAWANDSNLVGLVGSGEPGAPPYVRVVARSTLARVQRIGTLVIADPHTLVPLVRPAP